MGRRSGEERRWEGGKVGGREGGTDTTAKMNATYLRIAYDSHEVGLA